MPTALITNLGLGDQILCNGLVRELAKKDAVVLPCEPQNFESVVWMFTDNPAITVEKLQPQSNANQFAKDHAKAGHHVLDVRPGENHSDKHFDQYYYRRAGIDHRCRYSSFNVPRHPREAETFKKFCAGYGLKGYAFVHDDAQRGWRIDPRLPRDSAVVRPERGFSGSIFAWRQVIEAAQQIHCIDSAFLCWIDQLAEDGIPLFWHKSARPVHGSWWNPSLRRHWQIV